MSFEASTSRATSSRVANAASEAAIITHALVSREAERPINTRKAYTSRQKLFEVKYATVYLDRLLWLYMLTDSLRDTPEYM